ncbi:MlaD family protein [Pararobbsia silviterrae]|nr:MlaD family protein [Pararobbsia silviterrae]
MEARAHHVVIGLFTVIVVAAAMLFAMWLATGSAGRKTTEYDVVFSEPVVGLTEGNGVQYSGIKVGEVERLTLDPENPAKVRARIRVGADTPVKRDTVAKLALTGVTGISVIQLSGGSAQSERLTAPDGEIPVIIASPSSLAQLALRGGDVIANLDSTLHAVQQVLSDRNLEHIDATLENLSLVAQSLADQRDDIHALVSAATHGVRDADAAAVAVQGLAEQSRTLVSRHGEAIFSNTEHLTASLAKTSDALNAMVEQNASAIRAGSNGAAQLAPTLEALQQTLASLREVTRRFDDNPSGYLLNRDKTREFSP